MKQKKSDGKALNALVHIIEHGLRDSEKTQIFRNKKLPDRITNSPREFDVLLELDSSHHKFISAIECKDYSRKVDIAIVEAFKTKCDDCNINRKILVSSSGFTKSARSKAHHYGIECYELSATRKIDWARTDTMTVALRKMLHTNIRFIVPKGSIPEDTSLYLTNAEGIKIADSEVKNYLNQRFADVITPEKPIFGEIKVTDSFFPYIATNAENHSAISVNTVLLIYKYEIINSKQPLMPFLYRDSDGKTLAKGMYAETMINGISGILSFIESEEVPHKD